MIRRLIILLLIVGCEETTAPEPDDCAGVAGGTAELDCFSVCGGVAIMDDCGLCTGGTTGLITNSSKDCAGVCGGDAQEDSCGVCEGANIDEVCAEYGDGGGNCNHCSRTDIQAGVYRCTAPDVINQESWIGGGGTMAQYAAAGQIHIPSDNGGDVTEQVCNPLDNELMEKWFVGRFRTMGEMPVREDAGWENLFKYSSNLTVKYSLFVQDQDFYYCCADGAEIGDENCDLDVYDGDCLTVNQACGSEPDIGTCELRENEPYTMDIDINLPANAHWDDDDNHHMGILPIWVNEATTSMTATYCAEDPADCCIQATQNRCADMVYPWNFDAYSGPLYLWERQIKAFYQAAGNTRGTIQACIANSSGEILEGTPFTLLMNQVHLPATTMGDHGITGNDSCGRLFNALNQEIDLSTCGKASQGTEEATCGYIQSAGGPFMFGTITFGTAPI